MCQPYSWSVRCAVPSLTRGEKVTSLLTALGQWPNAPLAIVVAQIRFEPTMETDYAVLAEKIRQTTGEEFPVINDVQEFSFVVGDGGQSPRSPEAAVAGSDLRSADGARCIRLQQGAITYSTCSYRDSKHFSGEWRKLLDALCAGGKVHALRLGLRYIDFIIPSEGRVPEDYVCEGFGRSPDALDEQAPIAFSLYDYERPHGGRLRIQYGRGFGPPSLPPDLMDAVPPPPFLVAKYDSGLSAVLDMDRWRPASEMMSAEVLAKEFQILHGDMSKTFQRIITPIAAREWQEKPSQGA